MKNIAIYGAGGMGREVACLIKQINSKKTSQWNFIGFFDDYVPAGAKTPYGTILGDIETLNSWPEQLAVVFAIGSSKLVFQLHSKITNPRLTFPNLIAPDTLFLDEETVTMGQGNIICNRCMISFNVTLGDFNLINNNTAIGHDTTLGSYNSIMPSVKISGAVTIGDRNLLGVNSVILHVKGWVTILQSELRAS